MEGQTYRFALLVLLYGVVRSVDYFLLPAA